MTSLTSAQTSGKCVKSSLKITSLHILELISLAALIKLHVILEFLEISCESESVWFAFMKERQ
ncbi:CLUMA_CG005229, isoform A [Clunio marinus]|uniref:CLUMA_CG005229, isoform A n=1 Tax=Clunio marinus TaxID=568069 RepID=A0A1J1HU27_9DIPT|nr:CLUMA_CG005229, isoform A [Clunio marinus]